MGGKPPLILRIMGIPFVKNLGMKFLIPKSKEKALNNLERMGHSHELICTLPDEFRDAYFSFNLIYLIMALQFQLSYKI